MATYFVKNGGDNCSDGLSDANAWATLCKVNGFTFSVGDTIQLKRGSTWRERLIPPNNGSAGNPITFQAYGSGNKPRIIGADLVKGWVSHSGNIYKITISGGNQLSSDSCWEDDTNLKRETSLAAVDAPGKFFNDGAGTLYAWTIDGTDPDIHTMELGVLREVVTLDNRSFVTLDNLQVEKGRGIAQAVIDAEAGSNNLIIQNCLVARSGRRSKGIRIRGGTGGVIVQDCEVTDCSNTAIGIDNHPDSIIRRNTVHDTGSTLEVSDRGGIMIGTPNLQAPRALVEGNTLYNIGPSSVSGALINPITIDHSNDTIVRYNIIHDCIKGGIIIAGSKTSQDGHISGCKVYYNLIYNHNPDQVAHSGAAGGIYVWNGDDIDVFNNTIWNFNTAGGIQASPLFSGANGETVDDVVFRNNIIGPVTGANRRQVRHKWGGTWTNFISDSNSYYDSAGLILTLNNADYTTLTSWQSATGLDASSIDSDRLLVDPGTLGDFLLRACV